MTQQSPFDQNPFDQNRPSMTDTTSAMPWRAPHTLISWPAVIAGAVVAVTVGAMLNLLGVALGATAFNPYDLDGGDAEGFSAAAGAWMAISNALALFVGAAVASRAAKHSDDHRGGLHGLAVWATAFLLAIFLASSTAAGGVAALLGGESQRVGAEESFAGDVLTPDRRIGEETLVVPREARDEAEAAAETTGTLALWAFLAMLLGAVAAVFGGLYGTRNHRWMTKAGIGDADLDPAHRRV